MRGIPCSQIVQHFPTAAPTGPYSSSVLFFHRSFTHMAGQIRTISKDARAGIHRLRCKMHQSVCAGWAELWKRRPPLFKSCRETRVQVPNGIRALR
jgi:hypothetical protein